MGFIYISTSFSPYISTISSNPLNRWAFFCLPSLFQGAVEGPDQNHLDGSDANQRIAQVPVDVIRQELLTWKLCGGYPAWQTG